tara:strand:+ start:1402 stop:1806 length:405 start_codon:yes stop_codon:yes gene_type:complete
MKYSPFDGSLDRVIEELLEQNKSLKFQLDLATQELARMDDRAGTKSKKEKEDGEDPFVQVLIGPYVSRVGYENGDLFYEVRTSGFQMREGVVLTEAQLEDEDFEYEESETEPSVINGPEIRTVYHRALDCDGNE